MAIIYALTGETFKGGVNNVYFNGVRQNHVGTVDNTDVRIAYDCNTACVNIAGLQAQITDWALETCWQGSCDAYIRLRYWWYEHPDGHVTLCDCWQRDPNDNKLVYTSTSYFRPNACFCACIYGYGCSPRHFVSSAPFGNVNCSVCFNTNECDKYISLNYGGSWAYTEWQRISCWEWDCLANVGWRPQIDVYSYPAYGVTTCIRGKNQDGMYYYCGLNSSSGNIVLDH